NSKIMKTIFAEAKLTIDDLKEALSYNEVIELVKHIGYDEDILEDIFTVLNVTDDELFGYITSESVNRYISNDIDYYDVTSKMKTTIELLESKKSELELENKKLKKQLLRSFNNHHEAKEFFCDLFDLSHHADTEIIINHVSELINHKRSTALQNCD
ncbi:MAG: hypothetical protein L3J74_08140, partial [Bacteroidales bacterium]|nr:hypothetical protein [Bacteroidales bacterium]